MTRRTPLYALVLLASVSACGAAGEGEDGGDSSGTDSGAGTTAGGPTADGWERAYAEDPTSLSCSDDAEALLGSGAPMATVGDATIVAGYRQSSGNNQDPIVARVDGDSVTWCTSHETSAPDGRAVGLTWDGGPDVYVLFTVVGGGSELDDIADGWQTSYGMGGGPKVSLLARLDAATGDANGGTYVLSKLMNGNTNTHGPREAPVVRPDGDVEFLGSSAFSPLNPDGSRMDCSEYPFDYRAVFSPDLAEMRCASCTNCTATAECPPP